jgi:hypothetical protein
MRPVIMLTAIVVLPLAAPQTRAQNYHITIKEYADVGKSSKVTEQATTRSAFSVALGDKVLKEEKKVEVVEQQYSEKVVKAGAAMPDKFTQSYTKAVKGSEGMPVELSYAGKTIVFERKGGAYVVTAEEGVNAQDIEQFTKRANRPEQLKALLPKTAVKAGDSWTVGKEVLAFLGTDSGAALGVDVNQLKARGKLVKAYKKGNEQWGTVELDFIVPMAKLGPLALDTPIDIKFKMTLDTAIDGSSTAGEGRGTSTLKGASTFTQNGMTFRINLSIDSQMRRDSTAEE